MSSVIDIIMLLLIFALFMWVGVLEKKIDALMDDDE